VKKLPKFDDQNIDLPFGIPVQKGIVDNFSGIQKFGYNSAVPTTFETVWDGSTNYTYISTAGTATVTSSNTAADNGGTVEIQGLDASYNLQTVVATIGGSATTETFIRVFRARMITANTGNSNVGTITVTVDSTSAAIISPANGQTLMCVYTIPANYKGYLLSLNMGTSKQKEVEIKLLTKDATNGDVFNTKAYQTTFGVPFTRSYLIPEVFTEKTDIEIRAKADATTAVSAGFELVLEDVTYSS